MTLNLKKEEFSIAYLHSITSFSGFKLEHKRIDDDSIDCAIESSMKTSTNVGVDSPEIKIQLKATSQNLISESFIKFKLSKKNYNDLRSEKVSVPRYLVVLLLPDDENWLKESSDKTELYNKLYYHSLKGMPDLSDSQESITIDIPLSQTFTANVLKDILNTLCQGE